jgi:predicted O-methyltransferase YrrM
MQRRRRQPSADADGPRRVDEFAEGLLIGEDAVLDAALADSEQAGLPPIAVTASQGRMLNLLARIHGARRILEVGTLGGYSTIWLARALPEGGQLVSLELEEAYARVAEANIARAGLAELVEVRVGPALASLRELADSGADPFDLAFIDADKASTPEYFEAALELGRPGGVIVADNVVRGGALADPDSEDAGVQGMRRFHALVGAEPRVEATTIQTVGAKGWDGFTLVLIRA